MMLHKGSSTYTLHLFDNKTTLQTQKALSRVECRVRDTAQPSASNRLWALVTEAFLRQPSDLL